jgi:hypothetical protein
VLPHFTVRCNQQAQPHLPKLPGLPSVWDYSEARVRVNTDRIVTTSLLQAGCVDAVRGEVILVARCILQASSFWTPKTPWQLGDIGQSRE